MHLYFETTVLKILYVLVNINEALYAVLLTALKDDRKSNLTTYAPKMNIQFQQRSTTASMTATFKNSV